MTVPSESLLQAAAACYGLQASDLHFVKDAANVMYEFHRDGRDFMFRLTPGSMRSASMVQGEMAFIDYLAQHGGRVPRVSPSPGGNLVEVVKAGDEVYLAAVFRKAIGEHPLGKAMDAAVLKRLGRALAHMHRLSRGYQPPSPELARPEWSALEVFQFERWIPPGQQEVLDQAHQLVTRLQALPTSIRDYGMIHADPEPWNLLYHNGELTFIDFDDCCYHWFAFDLAVALYYAVYVGPHPDREIYAQQAWDSLYSAYLREHSLTPQLLACIPDFVLLRLLEDYAFTLRFYEPGQLQDWQVQRLKSQRAIIAAGGPQLHLKL